VGVQLVGNFGAESELLRISAQLETLSKWIARRPPAFS
jgi:Asp-tRNA(Asn)/Glu-tRNA(Gln) amidotransferase A subunit family amidase